MPSGTGEAEVRAAVDSVPGWYHTLDLPFGVTTPGWFDLRPVADRLPWPEVTGLRCLDVATWDGFFAFELEKRGAAEVLATDIASHAEWDHLPGTEASVVEYHEAVIGEKGRGFTVAAECLGSKVRREYINVYDLSPERVGTFDVVVCGGLLLHLRDPFRALAAIRSVCRTAFLSIEQVEATLAARVARRPALVLKGANGQWAVPNPDGHRRMLEMAGFRVDRVMFPYVAPLGVAHPPAPRTMSERLGALVSSGVRGQAVLCRPREGASPG